MNESEKRSKDNKLIDRNLKDYSIKDNVKYLKKNYSQVHQSLINAAKVSFMRYNQIKPDQIGEIDKFSFILGSYKPYVLDSLCKIYRNPFVPQALMNEENLNPIMDIFEWMFLNAIERDQF